MRALLALALSAALLAPAAQAQDVSAEPHYGSVRLAGGFLPDPHVTDVVAGGTVEVNRGRCTYGHVSHAPDVDFYYDGNGARTLYIYAVSGRDTIVLVNTPNGAWACDDDSYGDGDPILVIPAAASGLYNIWVGTYGDDMADATLFISEIDPR
jgi:opacity protein-like surface antigen